MKLKKKIWISALSVMLLMAIAVTALSFSFADNKDNGLDDSIPMANNDIQVSANTNIDNIINNSHSELEDADTLYHIAEIGTYDLPTGKATQDTKFGAFASGVSTENPITGFEQYVINGNRTIDKEMNPNSVDYRYFNVADIAAAYEDYRIEILKGEVTQHDYLDWMTFISSADFIYVSANPNNPYTKTNDICEELYTALKNHGTTYSKPMVIDKPDSTTGGGNSSGEVDNSQTMNTLVENVFGVNGKYYYTNVWKSGLTAEEYLSRATGSLYVSISGKSASKNWKQVVKTGDDKVYKLANVLVVSADGSTTIDSLSTQLFNDATSIVDVEYYVEETDATETDAPEVVEPVIGANDKVYYVAPNENGTSSIMYQYAYVARHSRPDMIKVTTISLADISNYVLDTYDMVIIDDNCAGESISGDDYKQFAAAMYGEVCIVYGSALGTVTDAPNTGDVGVEANYTNYHELFNAVATEEQIARYDWIMVTDQTEMDILTSSNSAATCKKFADIINKGAFRGIGGSGSSSNKYTVLEIQPCYPIDLELAEEVGKDFPRQNQFTETFGNGNYYTKPSDILNGMSKEQIIEGKQYYAWELSKAKLADALNLSVDQIELVQMSTEELACSKEEIFGTYDLVYIGGNTTALKDLTQYRGVMALQNQGAIKQTLSNKINELPYMPVYTMYTHSGEMCKVNISKTFSSSGGYGDRGGKETADIYLSDGTRVETVFTLLNGNDITYNKLVELKEYAGKGMPVVVSKELTAAYDIMSSLDNRYLQNSIDPDCNIAKFLDYCSGLEKDNVLWKFDDSNTEYTDNDGGRLGSTLTGEVEVFSKSITEKDTNGKITVISAGKDMLSNLCLNSNSRPKFTLNNKPASYNKYDMNSYITTGKLVYNFEVTGTKDYTVNYYIDENANSKFEDSELIKPGTAGLNKTNNSLSFELAIDGPVYWQLEIVDNSTGLASRYSDIAYLKGVATEPSEVRVLQILPDSQGPQGANNLYFCTVCQQAYEILEYNPYNYGSGYSVYYSGNYDQSADGVAPGGRYLGVHEHTFGIVSYDSNKEIPGYAGEYGCDDWDYNLADDVSDRFDFDLDIMLTTEFEEVTQDVINAYSADKVAKLIADYEATVNKDSAEYEEYEALETDEEKARFIYAGIAADYELMYLHMVKGPTVDAAGNAIRETDIDTGAVISITTKEVEDDLIYALEYMAAQAEAGNLGGFNGYTGRQLGAELRRLIVEERYSDYYTIGTTMYNDLSAAMLAGCTLPSGKAATNMDAIYSAYITVKDKELEYKKLYKKYDRYSNYDSAAFEDNQNNWLLGCYEAVVIGPSDDFGYTGDITDADALNVLKKYVEKDGTVLLFHDTLTAFTDTHSCKLTEALRESFGMDRYHMTATDTKADGSKYWPGTAITKYTANSDINLKPTIYGVSASVAIDKNTGAIEYDVVYDQANGRISSITRNTDKTKIVTDDGHDVAITMIFKDADGNPIANQEVTLDLNFTTLKNYYEYVERQLTATTDADGVAVFKTTNYSFTENAVDETDYYYRPYVLNNSTLSKDKYFMTNLSYKTTDDKYGSLDLDLKNKFGYGLGGHYLSSVAYTDAVAVGSNMGDENRLLLPYKYAEFEWMTAGHYNIDADTKNNTKATTYGTDRATQNNIGIVTNYPFTLGSQLNISGTHPQVYAIDIEDDDMTVWYSLAGGTNVKAGSSVFAATPNDGLDNYFIYSYGNVNYCGAGHSKITGVGKDNNDERRLYINIICNSVRPSTKVPSLTLHDYNADLTATETNNVIKYNETDGVYVVKVNSMEEYVEFSYKATTVDSTIKSVEVYYDLDYSTNTDPDMSTADKLIMKWTSTDNKDLLVSGQRNNVGKTDVTNLLFKVIDQDGTEVTQNVLDKDGNKATMLYLQPEYFNADGVAYIVVKVTDSNGMSIYKRIRIELKDYLFNLT